ncbi:DUF5134 domain-containing protein [Homoserinibacter sp. GY 40078]|uniref:DUF5134 domain-containing protein n=1 Tax=Homoserinibacter sp. GY 40078 TaxID=2603275 RepID=UPI0011CAD880|nr:DUF5134 domain-containing protein [Homoserinibacter sp. GY 40078]TXK18968.1 DUF5134 domain-containing protein [Homoserinibacter sp. GY 40078]
MLHDPAVAWVFTVIFGATGVYSVVLTIIDRRLIERVMHGLHILMSLAMIAMAWALSVPTLPQVLVFSIGALYCAAIWVRSLLRGGTGIAEHPPWMLGYHALMMLAMVWMVAPGTAGQHVTLPAALAATGALGAAGLYAGVAVAVADAAVCLVRRPPRTALHVSDDVSTAAMGIGMGAMTLAMAFA